MSPKKETQKSARGSPAPGTPAQGFTGGERAAMKERAREVKAEARANGQRADLALFHHAQGLAPGVAAFADHLRQAGHTVHMPDLFEGRTFGDPEQGMVFEIDSNP